MLILILHLAVASGYITPQHVARHMNSWFKYYLSSHILPSLLRVIEYENLL